MEKEVEKKFVQLSRSWYSSDTLARRMYMDQVTMGLHSSSGGVTSEAIMRWYKDGEETSAKLELFQDSFKMLSTCSDVFEKLAIYEGKKITPEEFCALLLECDFTDATETMME